MGKKTCLATAFTLLTFACSAQLYIEPLIGYHYDLVNSNRFKMINAALQLSSKLSKRTEIFLRIQKNWPIKNNSADSSFTTNPSLPLFAPAKKTIRPSSFSVAFGNRLRIHGANKHTNISIMFFMGYCSQRIDVDYQYEKNNYTILNPDVTIEKGGLFVGGGFEYMRLLKYGRLLFQLSVSSEPIGKKIGYPTSFKYMIPVSFNAGYSIPLKKFRA